MSELDTEDIEDLAGIYQALGNKTRLHILLQLSRDKPVSELKPELGISRSGLQKHVERLIDSELVYRPQEEGSKTYDLTPIGMRYVELLQNRENSSLTVLELLRSELEDLESDNRETRETLEEAGVDLTEFEQKLKEEAWQNIWSEARSELGLQE